MQKHNLFIDSIIFQILAPINVFNTYRGVVRLFNRDYVHMKLSSLPRDKVSKYAKAYILRDSQRNNEECIDIFSFTKEIKPYAYFIVYARGNYVTVEIHGLVQYAENFLLEKLSVVHLLHLNYKEYLSLSRLDIAIDIKSKFDELMIYDRDLLPIDIDENSSKSCFYYDDSKQLRYKRTRSLKAYDKTNQRGRGYPLPFYLTRIELTIRRSKLKSISSVEELYERVLKELSYYRIFISDVELPIDDEDIYELCRDLYQVLELGTNTLYYSNLYKNIKKQSQKSKLAYECFKANRKLVGFASENDISLKTLRKNIKFFKNIS